jgi:hypothetical protein
MSDTANRFQPARPGATAPRAWLVLSLAACLLLALGALSQTRGAAQDQGDVTVRLEPAAASGNVGDIFTVRVYVDNVPAYDPITGTGGVQGWQVIIGFDPAVVQLRPGQGASTYFAGNLYSTGGFNAFPVVNVASDKITLGQALIGAVASYPGGSDLLLATIQWQGAAGGASLLDTQGAQVIQDVFTGAAYSPLTELDGQITVAGNTPTETPPTAERIYLPLLLRARS